MRRFRLKTVALFSATTFCLSCSPTVDPASKPSLSITTTATEYTPGAVVTLTVTNNAESAVQFGLRDIILERQVGGEWTALPHDASPALLLLHDLAPGASAQFAQPVIPADAIPGTYRFRVLTTEISGPGSLNQDQRLSNEWRLQASGS